jgi:hypothetical protein
LIYLIISGDEYKLWSSPFCNFLHSPVTSSLLGPNILLSTLFSNTLNRCSSLNSTDQVSHPYKTTGRSRVAQSVQCLTTDWTDCVRSPTKAEDFSSNLCFQTGSGAHPVSCTMGTGGSFPGGKGRPGRDADHSPPSSADVKKE